MDWLDPPYQFFHPQPELPFELQIVRFEVGLARRPIVDPPGYIEKPTIRFHLATPIPPALWLAVRRSGSIETARLTFEELSKRPYVDFTNAYLIQKVLAIYDDLQARAERQIPFPLPALLAKLAPSQPEALTLRLTRHGLRIETTYDVEAVGV